MDHFSEADAIEARLFTCQCVRIAYLEGHLHAHLETIPFLREKISFPFTLNQWRRLLASQLRK